MNKKLFILDEPTQEYLTRKVHHKEKMIKEYNQIQNRESRKINPRKTILKLGN